MRDICIDTFLSVRDKMNPNRRKDVFELFGFDFLLDEDFRIWLIECNTNPYLGAPCEYMKKLVPEMVNDMFKIVVDPVFGPRKVPDEERVNGFQLIYREESDKYGPAFNARRPFNFDLCYPVPMLKPSIGKKKSGIYRDQPRGISRPHHQNRKEKHNASPK